MNQPVTQLSSNGPMLPTGVAAVSPSIRMSISVLGLLLLVIGGIALARMAQDAQRFPVTNVDVLGTVDYTDRAALMQAIGEHTGQGFYGLDIDRVNESVAELEWVANARVSRVWPSRIEIDFDEHEPAARWNDQRLISKQMVMFSPAQLQPGNPQYEQWREVFSSLPQIRGVDGRHPILLDAFRAYSAELEKLGLALEVLEEDERGSQTLQLSNRVTVRLGLNDTELRMQRFIDVYPGLSGQIGERASSFDMRYSNGFALGGVADSKLRSGLQEQSTFRGSLQMGTETFPMKRNT